MGTPVCRKFTPTRHQDYEAAKLILEYENITPVTTIHYVIGCLINHTFSYGGEFKYNVQTLGYKKSSVEISQVGNVEDKYFFIYKDIIAVWRNELLKWELVYLHPNENLEDIHNLLRVN